MTAAVTYKSFNSRSSGTSSVVSPNVSYSNSEMLLVCCITNESYTNDSNVGQDFTIAGAGKWRLLSKTGYFFTSNSLSKSMTAWICIPSETGTSDVTVDYANNCELSVIIVGITGLDTSNTVIQVQPYTYDSGQHKLTTYIYNWNVYKTTSNVFSFACSEGTSPISLGNFSSETHTFVDSGASTYQYSIGLNTVPETLNEYPSVTTQAAGFGFAVELRDANETKYPVVLTHTLKEFFVKPYPNHGLFPVKQYDMAQFSSVSASVSNIVLFDSVLTVDSNPSTTQDMAQFSSVSASVSNIVLFDSVLTVDSNPSTTQDMAQLSSALAIISSVTLE